MKKLLVLALTLPVLAVVLGGADCGGVTTCTSDADCAGKTNSVGDETPYCDADTSVCVPDAGECTEDLDCQLLNPDSATGTDDHECEANTDCEGDERCVETTTGFHKCAVVGDQADCELQDTDAVDVTDTDGDAASVCLAGGTCESNGACTF
ncbi:MAG: hypothetical protein IT383_13580 [Deltaproteobacteria bacterium]|nr:hypothetical protein [Deltaproteobacteria bacterium]